MSEDEELHLRNLMAEHAYNEKMERENEIYGVQTEEDGISISFKDYTKHSKSLDDVLKMIGYVE